MRIERQVCRHPVARRWLGRCLPFALLFAGSAYAAPVPGGALPLAYAPSQKAGLPRVPPYPATSPYRLRGPAMQLVRKFAGQDYRLAGQYRAVQPPQRPAPYLKPGAPIEEMPYHAEIEKAARHATLDPALVHAVIHVESRYRQDAVSPRGAQGLMQVMPTTAARYGVNDPGSSRQANLRAGTLYLRDLMNQFDQRIDLVLAAYNAGEGAVIRHARQIPPYRETRNYVQAVMQKYREWRDEPIQLAAERPQHTTEYLPGTRLDPQRQAAAPVLMDL